MADLYGWDRSSQRFRDLESGRYVSERAVRDGVDRMADLVSRRMGEVTARYRTGEITATVWQSEMRSLIKQSQIAGALAAYGGRGQMDASRWGVVGQQVRVQYAYLARFTDDVLAGRQRMNGRMDARARQYGQASRTLYENIRRRESGDAGFRYERNELHPADHCEQCVNQTALGTVPIGSLVPIGRRTCRSQCRCTLVYSRQMTVEEAA